MKKFFAWLLAALMIVSSLPVVAFADNGVVSAACPGKGHTLEHNLGNAVNPIQIGDPVPPTCTELGYTLYQCQGTDCGEYFAADFISQSHDWKVTTPATCTTKGVETCDLCKDTREIAALGHIKPLEYVDGKGNCTVPGYATYKCTREGCDYTETIAVGGDGHDWELIAVLREPTCDTDGIGLAQCINPWCLDEKEVVINHKTDNIYHDMTKVPAVNPTCAADGNIEYYHCNSCEADFYDAAGEKPIAEAKDKVIKGGHGKGDGCYAGCTTKDMTCAIDQTYGLSGNGWVGAYIAPTCLFAGSYNRRCEDCGEVYIDIVFAPLGHAKSHKDPRAVNVQAAVYPNGCLEPGYINYECVCGLDLQDVAAATGHAVKTVEVPGTCISHPYTYTYCTNAHCKLAAVSSMTVEGVAYNVAANGNAVKLLSIEVSDGYGDHVLVNGAEGVQVNPATCTTPGSIAGVCTLCDFYTVKHIGALGHNFEYVKTVDVTCVADGYDLYDCTRCDATEKRNIVKFNFGDPDLTDIWDYYPSDANPLPTNMDWNAYMSKEEAVAAGHINLNDGIVLRDGNCLITGIILYACADPGCGRNVLVIEENTGLGHAVKISCEDYECAFCGEILKGLGHSWILMPYMAPTCESEGVNEHHACRRKGCGAILENIKVIIPKLEHKPGTLVDSRDPECDPELYGFDYYDCPNCEGQYEGLYAGVVENYEKYDEHHMVNVREDTCTATGRDECDRVYLDGTTCDYYVEYDEVVHKNAAGQILSHSCLNADVLDRHCVNCDTDIIWAHGAEFQYAATYPATCQDPAYDLYLCPVCMGSVEGGKRADYFGEADPNGHVGIEWTVVKAPSYTAPGKEVMYCNVPGCCIDDVCTGTAHEHTPAIVTTREIAQLDLEILLEVENAIVADADIVDSSFVDVKVFIDADKGAALLWGAELSVNYDAAHMWVAGIDFTPAYDAGLVSNAKNFSNDGVVNFAVSASENNDGAVENITIDGKVHIATITFKVSAAIGAPYAKADAVKALVSVADDYEIINVAKEDLLADTSDEETIVILPFLNLDADLEITLKDAEMVAEMFINGGYNAAADVDKDGEITYNDFYLYGEYIVGNVTYNDLCNLD